MNNYFYLRRKISTKEKTANFIMLTLMYTAAWLNVLSEEIVSMTKMNVIIIKYMIVISGSIYFLSIYIKNFSGKDGKIIIPCKGKNLILLILWFFFSNFVILSQSFNGSLPIEGISYLIFTPLVFFLVIPLVLYNSEETIMKASLLSSFPYLIFSALYEPPVLGSSYSGITYNPNSIGQISGQAAISSFCLFLVMLNEKRKSNFIIYLLLFIISLRFSFLSNSRTVFLAILITCFFTLILFIVTKRLRPKNLLLPITFFFLIYFYKLRQYLQMGILSKFNRYIQRSNILSSRQNIWRQVLDGLTIFGHGPNYFSIYIGKGAHNSIIEIIGVNGIIAGIIIALIYIFSVLYGIKYAFDNKNKKFFHVPFMVTTFFFVLSMAESMFGIIGKGITLIYFNILGIMIFKKDIKG